MSYRLYQRDPVNIGDWYYAITCKGCQRPIHLFKDPSNGVSKIHFAGDGDLSTSCSRCLHHDTYSAKSIQRIQTTENIAGTYPPRTPISNSSRKPIWNSYPKAAVTFGVGYIEDRPVAASIVARIITSWADIEIQCARLLAELMQIEIIPAAAAVFGSLKSSRVQYDALHAAAAITLSSNDMELFEAHMSRRSSLEKERNDLAHGCFGVSVQIPDHIVWVSQYDYLLFSAGIDPENFAKKKFVYELGTLERIAQEIEEYYNQLGSFRGYLWSRRDGANGEAFRAQRYPQLCNQPHIREALGRVRTAKKSAKARRK